MPRYIDAAQAAEVIEPLKKSDLYEKRGCAVLVGHVDGSPMIYGMDRCAAVLDTTPIYGAGIGVTAIYGRGLTLGDSEYGITWVAYDYNYGADVAPVVHAAWEYLGVSDGKKIYQCTNCTAHIYGTHPYCKECGAKMERGSCDG